MALGKVQVNNLNLGQGDIAAIERHFSVYRSSGGSR